MHRRCAEENKMTPQEIEQEDYIDRLEKEHRELLEEMSETQWLEVFPEVVPLIPQILRERVEIAKQLEQSIRQKMTLAKVLDPVSGTAARWKLLIGECAVLKKVREDIWRLKYRTVYVRPKTSGPNHVTQEEIELARNIPITSLVGGKTRRSGKHFMTLCPLHKERTPSFVVYPDNRFYCFGCNEGGDSIDLVQKLHGLDFVDAVKQLINH